MNEFLFLTRAIASGKSITRSILDYRLKHELLKGRIIDLGAGKRDMYGKFIPQAKDSTYELMDLKQGATVNFETDALPYADRTFDTLVLLNVLEHIFNHGHLLREIHRIKKTDGELVGFVPFLMWYHPDHHDYFRYTHEALEEILRQAGYASISIEILHKGPYIAALQMIYPTLPKFLRLAVFPLMYGIDSLFILLRKGAAKRYALGYYFKAR